MRAWGSGSVDGLPYLGPRLPVVAVGDEMVDRSFRWSDCGRSVFRGPPRLGWVPRSLLELAALQPTSFDTEDRPPPTGPTATLRTAAHVAFAAGVAASGYESFGDNWIVGLAKAS